MIRFGAASISIDSTHERPHQSHFPELRVAGRRRPPGASAMRCARWASTSGSTRARCAVATRGMRRSAGRSRIVRCSCRSSQPTRKRARKVTSVANGISRASRTLDMADDKAFLLPVVIDATIDVNARVPEKFREVQWTHLPAGEASAAFAERVQRSAVWRHRPAIAGRATACRAGGSAGRCRIRPGTAVDRRAAVRQHEPRRGERVFRRWPAGRTAERAGEDPRPARGVAHVGVLLQGQGRRHPDDRAEAQRGDRARRQRPQGPASACASRRS